ncbi:MAG: DUF4296 domain-containing protein [Dysgonamonadaceae bacterium]|nr:DUF4296 domain-containing protein [Dysgonamonadaceae bacterium]
MKNSVIIVAMLLPLIFTACRNSPYKILSDRKMEALLFDLYIAEAGMNNNITVFAQDSARKSQLLESVLKLHDVTRAQLDSSLLWYAGNLDRYIKVNENVERRYVSLIENLDRQQQTKATTVNPDVRASDTNFYFMPLVPHVEDFKYYFLDTVKDTIPDVHD